MICVWECCLLCWQGGKRVGADGRNHNDRLCRDRGKVSLVDRGRWSYYYLNEAEFDSSWPRMCYISVKGPSVIE